MVSDYSQVFHRLRAAAMAEPHPRYIASEGGARSGKTVSALQFFDILLENDKPGDITSVVSESLPHLKRGAIRDYEQHVIKTPLHDRPEWNASNLTFTYPSGGVLEFFSVDSPEKVLGPARKRLFVNEANHIKYETFRQLAVRTSGLIIYDYNPECEFWGTEIIPQRNNFAKIHSTFKDNDFLSQAQKDEIIANQTDENWWRVYGLGLMGRLDGLIFTNFEQIDQLPDNGFDTEVWGMDFGYPVSPTTLMQVRLNFRTRDYYVRQRIWDPHLLTQPLTDVMRSLDVPRNALIYADCAEPKTIQEIRGYGFPNIRPCYKGKTVAEQLKSILGWKLHVTKDSLDYIKELRTLTWAKDRAGNPTGEPSKGNDHGIDAVRYALYTYNVEHAGGWSYSFLE